MPLLPLDWIPGYEGVGNIVADGTCRARCRWVGGHCLVKRGVATLDERVGFFCLVVGHSGVFGQARHVVSLFLFLKIGNKERSAEGNRKGLEGVYV